MNDIAKAALEVTQKWATEELESARIRAMNLRVGGEAYNHAIEAVSQLTRIIEQLAWMTGEPLGHPLAPIEGIPWAHDTTESRPEPESTEPEADEPEEPEEPKEAEPEEPARVIDIAEVRTKAKAARDAGVTLMDVWGKFGGTKLSDVPTDKYGEVLDLLDKLMQEAD